VKEVMYLSLEWRPGF